MNTASTLATKPALGAIFTTHEYQEHREKMTWTYRMSRLDYSARSRAFASIVDIAESIRTGRRLDIIASDLLVLATQVEAVVQPRAGGWPLRFIT